MPDLNLGPDIGPLPAYDIVEVKGAGRTRRVAIIGLLTDDKTLYRPGAFNNASIDNVLECAEKMQDMLYKQHGVDLVLPMTHQVISLDRHFADKFANARGEAGAAFPLIIGGHDHEPYDEVIDRLDA
jgi:2',3'-cyclic-nucleotide 2'-phosphodiesterase (5'-nucleotidase family)